MPMTITVRQTRNPLVGDVQYIASKKVSLPDDPNAFINLGFGKSSEEFAVISSWIWLAPLHPTEGLSVDSIRGTLSYDETLGPTLIAVELNDLQASVYWAEDQARLQKQQQYADRAARLKWLLAHPWRCIASLSPASLEPRSKIPTLMTKSDESIHDLCKGQTSENVEPTVSKSPYFVKSSDVCLRQRGISKLAIIAEPDN